MRVEQVARRSVGIVFVALLGVAVYFQAAGAAELVAARSLRERAVAASEAHGNGGTPRQVAARSSTSGDAVLALNPFDAVTGPLARGARERASAQMGGPLSELGDVLNAPPCADVRVNIVSESSDPKWSVAQLAGPGDMLGSARRVGDAVGALEVAYIGFDAAKLSPAVWLSGEKTLCHVLLFAEKGDRAAADASRAVGGAARESLGRSRGGRASGAVALPAEIADRIQRISDTELVVERSVIDAVLEDQARLIGSPRVVPEQKDGETIGVRLFGIEPETLLGTLGLQNGDRLERINGYEVANPVKALEAFAVLPTAASLSVQLTRRGKPTTLEIQIR